MSELEWTDKQIAKLERKGKPMTRRERLERKVERRKEWAEKAEARSEQHYNVGHKMMDAIPFGQPILVGHHSEKRDRNFRGRIHGHMSKFVEERKLAAHHESKADGLATQLERTIFTDDHNATEALEQRVAENEAKRDRMKKINAMYRKGDAAGLEAAGLNLEQLREKLKTAYSWCQQPYPSYELTNLGARIREDKKRIEIVKQQASRRAEAEAAPNGVVLKVCNEGYCRVTFAEKPARSVIEALKAAGFWWGNASWSGKLEVLPQSMKDMLEAKPEHVHDFVLDADDIRRCVCGQAAL